MLVRVGFSRGTSLVSRLVCLFTGTDVSHTFFLVQSEAGEWVYEAHTYGFHRVPWDEFSVENTVLGLVDMDWPHVEVKRALDRMLGIRYPFLSLFFMGLLIILKRAVRRPRRLVRDGMDCVTSVCRLTKEFARIDLGEVITPAELREKLRRR